MENLVFLPFFLQSFPEGFVVITFGLTLTGARLDLKKIAMCALLATLFSFVVRSLQIVFGIHAILQLLAVVLLVRVIIKLPLYWSATAILSGVLALGILESIFLPALLGMFNITLNAFLQDIWLRAIFPLPYTAGLGAVTYYLHKKGRVLLPMGKPEENREELFPKATKYLFIIGIMQAFLLILLNIAYYAYASAYFPSISLNTLFVLTTVTLFLTTILTVLVAYHMMKVSRSEAELRAQSKYAESMQILYLAVRSQRHDFINHVLSLYGMLMAEDIAEAKDYMKELYREVRLSQTMLNVGIPSLSGLLQTKSTIASELGVNFELSTDPSFAEIPLKPAELTALVGNLIDNAFDAIQESKTANPYIRVELYKEADTFLITVKNSGNPLKEDDLHKVLSAGYSTKDKSHHSGLGLYVVNSLAKKYAGTVRLTDQDITDRVTFTVAIPEKAGGRNEDSNRGR